MSHNAISMSVGDNEFALIARFRAAFPASVADGLLLGPGDDAALLTVPVGQALAMTTDTLVIGRHFPSSMPPALIGWRALAVNLSDLAAMGAVPFAFQVAITLPSADGDWLHECALGMARLAAEHGAVLAGGNISRGELSITITATGLVSPPTALRRDGARVGDGIYVSGKIGLAAQGLVRALRFDVRDWPELLACCSGAAGADLARYVTPDPRVALGRELCGVASAALDVSDGLLADLAHLCAASGVGARVISRAIPVPAGADVLAAASAGDDYELCFTVAPAAEAKLAAIAGRVGVALTRIGDIVAGEGVSIDGAAAPHRSGYLHFDA